MQQVNLQEASTQLSSLIAAAIRGEAIFITTDDHNTIRLLPVTRTKSPRQFGSAKGQIWMADDFDDPLDGFREYMP